MYIFGGFIEGEKTNELYRYDFKGNSWEKVNALSKISPPNRAGHSSVIIDNQMIIFGGKDDENEKLNDTWVFDLNSQQWENCNPEEPLPINRSGHSATVYQNLMIIFGGIHEVTRELDDCWIFDPKNKSWVALFEETTNQQKERSAMKNSPFIKR